MLKKNYFYLIYIVFLVVGLLPDFGYSLWCGDGYCEWYENCSSCPSDCGCDYNKECVSGKCKISNSYACSYDSKCASNYCVHNVCRATRPYCGDRYCDYKEDCSSCPSDCGCGYGKECVGSGNCKISNSYACSYDFECASNYCVHNVCRATKTYCGDGYCDSEECSDCSNDCSVNDCKYNGQCDTAIGENCQNSQNDCSCSYDEECNPNSYRANNKGCEKLCGNGRIDSNENCKNCPSDVECQYGYCSDNGDCVECIKDEHCNQNKKPLPGENNYCSGGDLKIETKYTIENCVYSSCQEKTMTDIKTIPCENGLCQDGHCGCSTGYSGCNRRCQKIKSLNMNEPCECDFQCKSDFCFFKKCSKALSVEIKAEKTIAKVGEEIDLTISLVNELTDALKSQLILNAGSGVTLSRTDGADICTSAQCTTYDVVDGKNSKSINVRIEGKQSGSVEITGKIKYEFENKTHDILLNKEIRFIRCGDGKCENQYGETKENCCNDCGCQYNTRYKTFLCQNNKCVAKFKDYVYFASAGFFLLIIIILLIVKKTSVVYKIKEKSTEKKHIKKKKRHKKEQSGSIKKVEEKQNNETDKEKEIEKPEK